MKFNIFFATLCVFSLSSSINACCPPDGDDKEIAKYWHAVAIKGASAAQSPAQASKTLDGWKSTGEENQTTAKASSCPCEAGSRSASPVNTQSTKKK